jgi:hypothetical protein
MGFRWWRLVLEAYCWQWNVVGSLTQAIRPPSPIVLLFSTFFCKVWANE